MEEQTHEEDASQVSEQRGKRYTSRNTRRLILTLPETIAVDVPETPGIALKEINVVLDHPGSQLWVEFDLKVFEYMIATHDTDATAKRRKKEEGSAASNE